MRGPAGGRRRRRQSMLPDHDGFVRVGDIGVQPDLESVAGNAAQRRALGLWIDLAGARLARGKAGTLGWRGGDGDRALIRIYQEMHPRG